MKKHGLLVSIIIALLINLYSGPVLAHGGGGHGGFGGHHGGGFGHHGGFRGGYYGGIGGLYFGMGYPYGYRYGYGYPYYSPPVTIQAPPITYIQQPAPVVQQYPAGYWYYCTNPEGYYPYVKTCPNAWQQVAPVPPDVVK